MSNLGFGCILVVIAISLVLCVYFLAEIGAILLKIARALESGLLRGPQGPQGIQGPPGVSGTPEHPVLAPSGARKDLSEVLKKDSSGQWVHHKWVETDSQAEQAAFAHPARAVKRYGQAIDIRGVK